MEDNNELTRPFRIPRKNRNTNNDHSVPSKKVGHMQDTTRSPLAIAPTEQRNLYGRRIVPIKRRATSSTEDVTAQQQRSSTAGGCETTNSAMLMDDILQNMVLPVVGGYSKPVDVASDSNSAKSVPRALPLQESSLLTRARVERISSTLACHSFAQKGLMETLLEQKMLTGRIESHTAMGYYPCLVGDIVAKDEQMVRRGAGGANENTSVDSPPRRGPRTPPGSPAPAPPRRGPMTPPPQPMLMMMMDEHSPEAGQSSSESRSPSFRGRSEKASSAGAHSLSSSDQPVVKKRKRSSPKKPLKHHRHHAAGTSSDHQALIDEMATTFASSVPAAQLQQCLDADLRNVDQHLLLNTMKKVLSTLKKRTATTRCEPSSTTAEVSSSMSPGGGAESRNHHHNAEEAMDLVESDYEDGSPPPPPPLPPMLPPPPPPPISTYSPPPPPPPSVRCPPQLFQQPPNIIYHPRAPPPSPLPQLQSPPIRFMPPYRAPTSNQQPPRFVRPPSIGEHVRMTGQQHDSDVNNRNNNIPPPPPTQVQMIQTLLQALAIPTQQQQQQSSSDYGSGTGVPPSSTRPTQNNTNDQHYSMPPVPSSIQDTFASTQPVPPAIYDRYGAPLPIPPSSTTNDGVLPPPFQPGRGGSVQPQFGTGPPPSQQQSFIVNSGGPRRQTDWPRQSQYPDHQRQSSGAYHHQSTMPNHQRFNEMNNTGGPPINYMQPPTYPQQPPNIDHRMPPPFQQRPPPIFSMHRPPYSAPIVRTYQQGAFAPPPATRPPPEAVGPMFIRQPARFDGGDRRW